ncbi:MAG: LysR substrate-binding domain-containing protein [Comamonadaceae bacterium]|nr:LysR substrate-binding domain-containing protein [Comamonadaceae bacterium]
MRAHPEVKFEVVVADRIVDLVEEGFDLAIRIGAVGSEQLVARRLGTMHLVLCAAPAYLKRRGTPRSAADLRAARRADLRLRRARRGLWTLRRCRRASRSTLQASAALHANSGEVLVAAGRGRAWGSCWSPTSIVAAGPGRRPHWCACCPDYEGGSGRHLGRVSEPAPPVGQGARLRRPRGGRVRGRRAAAGRAARARPARRWRRRDAARPTWRARLRRADRGDLADGAALCSHQ